jgi:hypothetical protein
MQQEEIATCQKSPRAHVIAVIARHRKTQNPPRRHGCAEELGIGFSILAFFGNFGDFGNLFLVLAYPRNLRYGFDKIHPL